MSRRVLVVSHEASRTGAPKVARFLLDALADDWDTVLVHRWGGPMQGELDRAAGRSFLEPAARVRVTLKRFSLTKPLVDPLERWAIRRTLRRERPDLVWCNTVMTARYATEAIAAGIPVVLHGHEQETLVAQATTRTGLAPLASSPLLTLVGCASDTAATLAGVLGGAGDAAVLHSPIDVDAVQASVGVPAPASSTDDDAPARRRVVAVGVGDHRKGLDVFNAAASSSVAAGDGIEWVWVGRVADADRIPAATYTGEVPSAAALVATAEVVVLPSRADPFPLVVLEAMALGRPVVASDLPGPREQLGDAGVFVPVGDPDALRGAVRSLLDDSDRRVVLGRSGEERCRERWGLGPFGRRARELADVAAGRVGGTSVR